MLEEIFRNYCKRMQIQPSLENKKLFMAGVHQVLMMLATDPELATVAMKEVADFVNQTYNKPTIN